jgi:hypothetical protein
MLEPTATPAIIARFELRALGCIIVRDMVVDTLRAAVGLPRRIPPSFLPLLAERSRALEHACRNCPTRASIGIETARPLTALVQALVIAAPELYGAPPLRDRCVQALGQACAGALGALALADTHWMSVELAGDLSILFVVMAIWSLAEGIQLWRAQRVVNAVMGP